MKLLQSWNLQIQGCQSILRAKRIPNHERQQQNIGYQNRYKGINVSAKRFPSEPLLTINPSLFWSPLCFLQSLSKNQWWWLLERALGSPRGLRKAGCEEPFEEEREAPCSEKRGVVGAEEWWVVPVEVAGDLGGDEELRVEVWCGCGAG